MPIPTAPSAIVLLSVLGLFPNPALQAQAPQAPASANPLGGPKLAASAGTTLIDRDFNGRLRRLERHPAEVALTHLTLDATVRARVDRIIAERAAILDQAVRNNFETILNLTSAGGAGDASEAVRLGILLTQKLKPIIARGSLDVELAKILPPEQREQMQTLVREYFDAVVAEEGKPRFEALSGETLRLWGEQLRLSFERQLADGSFFFEILTRDLKLRPDQEERARERYSRFVEETKQNPTKEQERQVFVDILAWLDLDQQKAIIRKVMELDGKRPPAAKPMGTKADSMMNPGGDPVREGVPPPPMGNR